MSKRDAEQTTFADPATAGAVLDRQGKARIYSPTQSVMQSGPRLRRRWVLEFIPSEAEHLDPLMGWPGSGDTRQEVSLRFSTREAAEAYARRHSIDYEVEGVQTTRRPSSSYADNFRVGRLEPWSH